MTITKFPSGEPSHLEAYNQHAQSYFDDLQPQDYFEEHLVQIIADTSWRLKRIPALEARLYTPEPAELAACRTAADPQKQAARAMTAAFRRNARAIDALGRHQVWLSNQFHRALSQFLKLRASALRSPARPREKAPLWSAHRKKSSPFVLEISHNSLTHQRLANRPLRTQANRPEAPPSAANLPTHYNGVNPHEDRPGTDQLHRRRPSR